MHCISKKGAFRTQPGYHTKQGELAGVEQGSSRKGASKKIDYWGGGPGVKFKEALKGSFVVVIKDIKFLVTENKGGKTAKKDWDSIELVNSQASNRVTKVVACKASWEDSIESLCVGGDAGRNSSHCTRCGGSEESNMISLGGEGDR